MSITSCYYVVIQVFILYYICFGQLSFSLCLILQQVLFNVIMLLYRYEYYFIVLFLFYVWICLSVCIFFLFNNCDPGAQNQSEVAGVYL